MAVFLSHHLPPSRMVIRTLKRMRPAVENMPDEPRHRLDLAPLVCGTRHPLWLFHKAPQGQAVFSSSHLCLFFSSVVSRAYFVN